MSTPASSSIPNNVPGGIPSAAGIPEGAGIGGGPQNVVVRTLTAFANPNEISYVTVNNVQIAMPVSPRTAHGPTIPVAADGDQQTVINATAQSSNPGVVYMTVNDASAVIYGFNGILTSPVSIPVGTTMTFQWSAAINAWFVTKDTTATGVGTTVPANTAVPTITGTAQQGVTLTAVSFGTWTGVPNPALTQQWQTSANGTTGWTPIVGATSGSYTVLAGDVGNYLRIEVTGTNSAGTVVADSAATAQIASGTAAPANTVVPTVIGTAQQGNTLTAGNGTWTGVPAPTFTYQWQTSANGTSGWTNIGGATAGTYVVASGDVGNYLRVAVTGTNGSGNATADSAATAQVTAPSTTPVPNNPNNAIPALAPGLWTFQPNLGDEFDTVFGSSGGTGLNSAKWSNGWFPGSYGNGQFGASGAGPPGSGSAWCDPAQVLVTSSPGNNGASSYGAIPGFTGAACLQLTSASKASPGGRISSSLNVAQGFIVSNNSLGFGGIALAPPFYIEVRVWYMPKTGAAGTIPGYPCIFLGSQSDPATGEIDVYEPLGGNSGEPVGHFHYNGDPNQSTSPVTGAAGQWVTIGVLFPATGNQCRWFAAVGSANMAEITGSVNGTGGAKGPFYWVLLDGYELVYPGSGGQQLPGIHLVDYVRVFH